MRTETMITARRLALSLGLGVLLLGIAAPRSGTAQSKKPAATTPKATAKLPAAATEMHQAMNGDRLVLKLPSTRTVAIVDVAKAKLLKTIRVSSEDFLLAAGGNRAVVYDPAASVFTTYDLEDYSRIKAKKSSLSGSPSLLAMGNNNAEFALVYVGAEILGGTLHRLDLQTLDTSAIEIEGSRHDLGGRTQIRISPDGQMIGAWRLDVSPSGQMIGALSGNKLKLLYEHDSSGHILPLPNRNQAVTGTGLVLSSGNRTITHHHRSTLYPDQTGHFYVGVTLEHDQTSKNAIYASGSHKMIGALNVPLHGDPWGREERTLYPNSKHKVASMLSPGKDEVQFYEFDPIGTLKASNLDYLVVLSDPPRSVQRGASFEYVPDVVTNAKSFEVELMDGPEGAKVVDGKLVWNVPKDFKGDSTEILLRVTGANKEEQFQDFKVEVKPGSNG